MVTVVIDGMNVAMEKVGRLEMGGAQRRALAIEGLELCLSYFVQCGVVWAKIFAPRGFVDGHRPEIEKLERLGVLFSSPGGLDDHFLLQHADKHGSFIVSNDRFLDHIRDRGYDESWLEYHRVPFMFDPDFAPEPDALVRMRKVDVGHQEPGMGPGAARRDLRAKPVAQPSDARRVPPPVTRAPPSAKDAFVLKVPRRVVGRIIGKAGANIKALTKEHGVDIAISDDAEDGQSSSIVTIARGDGLSRQAAADAILDIVDRASSSKPHSGAGAAKDEAGTAREEEKRRHPPFSYTGEETPPPEAMDIS